jgi:tRNA(Arg) A34 adenosine deaminase TadA
MTNSDFGSVQASHFLRHAIDLGRKGMEAGDGGPFGAVIVKEGVIIGEGWNRVVGTNDPTAHAEVVAIRDACRRINNFSLKGCDLYTSSEPCPMCLSAIYWARLSRVFYSLGTRSAADIGFDDRFISAQLALDAEKRNIPCIHVPDEEAQRMMDAYLANPERVRY